MSLRINLQDIVDIFTERLNTLNNLTFDQQIDVLFTDAFISSSTKYPTFVQLCKAGNIDFDSIDDPFTDDNLGVFIKNKTDCDSFEDFFKSAVASYVKNE